MVNICFVLLLALSGRPDFKIFSVTARTIGFRGEPQALLPPISLADSVTSLSTCAVVPYDAPVPVQDFPPFDAASANVFRYRQQQSVNLGSWFVHENWMTPSLFECAAGKRQSELDIASGWGNTSNARAVLERHWDTFVNQSDFEYLASIGINTVRLPIGYWNLGPAFCQDTAFAAVAEVYENCWPRIVRAINWAGEAGVGVLIDMHGAVGSQNGQSHSGISDGATNLFTDEGNTNKTIAALAFLTSKLANVTNMAGIQILNEPKNTPELYGFYNKAISVMRAVPTAANLPLYVHDAFNLESGHDFVAQRTDFVVQDHHSYFVFTPSDASETASQHTVDVNNGVLKALAAAADPRHNLFVGEWSCSLTPESMANEADGVKSRADFCRSQMNVYTNATAGWAFWSYDMEGCEDELGWCFKSAVNKTLPPTFFSYGGTSPPMSYVQPISNLPIPDMSNMTQMSATSTAGTSLLRLLDAKDSFASSSRLKCDRSRRHRRRFASNRRTRERMQRSDDYDLGVEISSTDRSTVAGFSDGFLTAKFFALNGMSKLGFVPQYMNDSLATQGQQVVSAGTEQNYRDGFLRGLGDGEAAIASIVANK